MKKLIYIFVLLLLSTHSYGQQFELTPMGLVDKSNSTKDYIVIRFPGKSQQELFNKTKAYITSIYNSAKDVMSVSEPDLISTFGVSKFVYKRKISLAVKCVLKHKVTIAFKEGRARVQFEIIDIFPEDPQVKNKIKLCGNSMNTGGIFNKEGEVKAPISKKEIEDSANIFAQELANYINEKNDNVEEDW